MTKAALILDNVVLNIIRIDRDLNEAELARFEAESAEYQVKLSEFNALKVRFDDVQLQLRDWKYHREFVMLDGSEFDRAHGREVRRLLNESAALEVEISKPPKPPKPPKGHYNPPEGHELVDIANGQRCGIGWLYKNGQFHKPKHIEDGTSS